MKLSKDELLKKISESGFDDEIAISLMEDISDSFIEEAAEDHTEELEQINGDLEALQIKYNELVQKYKDRFLNVIEVTEEPEPEEEDDGPEVIDVKEI